MSEGDRIAGIDVHKAMLAVVVVEGSSQACRCIARARFGAMESELRRLAAWLAEQQVGQVVMESTAQYGKPIWMRLQGRFQLYLAQAQSNRAPRGRKRDFRDAEQLAAMADPGLRASRDRLTDALAQAGGLSPAHRQILGLFLERLDWIDAQIQTLEVSLAESMRQHQDALRRLAEVPGLGPDSAQQIIAEVGPTAATFPSAPELAAWVGTAPGREESAGVSKSNRCPKGNCMMRRLLNQAANAAVRSKGSFFEKLYHRLVARLGHNKTIWAVANRLCRLVWKILHQGVHSIEHGNQPDPHRLQQRLQRMIRELKQLGYCVQPTTQTVA
jgi:transposase